MKSKKALAREKPFPFWMKSSKPLILLLLRHEETENPRGILYGQKDVPLSTAGRKKTEKLVAKLAAFPLTAVYASDLSRASYGARLLSEKSGAPLKITPHLREIDFGRWTGLTFEELLKIPEFRRRLQDPEKIRPPGGESLKDLSERALQVVSEIKARFSEGLVVVFAHGGLNRALIASLLDIPLRHFFSLEQHPGALNLLVFFSDVPPLLALFNAPPEIDLRPYLDYYGICAKGH